MRLPSILCCLCFAIMLLGCLGDPEVYKHMNFTELESYLQNLSKQYPHLMHLETAQEKYKLPYHQNCTPSSCPIYIATLTEFETLSPDRPQIFLSGAVHGDEIVGPNVVTFLANYLLKNYKKDPWLTFILQNRVIVIMPAANAQGYYYENREEIYDSTSFDPNRDFPYNQEVDSCMNTLTARAILKVFKDHMFVTGVTFHGGDNLIGYEWGSENHDKNYTAEESPDDCSMHQVGKLLQSEAGEVTPYNLYEYELGRMGDVIYSVQGGLEDWAYAASWANAVENHTHRTHCNSTTYGGFNDSELILGPQMIRFPLFLVETWLSKHPPDAEFGNEKGITDKNSTNDGHVPRNLRLCLAIIDMAKPYVRDIVINKHNSTHAIIKWKIGGALYVNETFVEWDYIEETSESRNESVREVKGNVKGNQVLAPLKKEYQFVGDKMKGVSVWIDKQKEFSSYVPLSVERHKKLILRIAAVTDQQWSMQVNPEPKLPPLTHFTRMRTVKNYIAAEDNALVYEVGVYSQEIMFVQEKELVDESKGIPVSVFVAVVTVTGAATIVVPIIIWLYFKRKYKNYGPMNGVNSTL